MPDPQSILVHLEPVGPGGSLRERLLRAGPAVAGEVSMESVQITVKLTAVQDDRPGPIKLRNALKKLRRACELAASWPTPRERRVRLVRRKAKGTRELQ